MKTIGYAYARNLMCQIKWQARVTMDQEMNLIRMEVFHPEQPNTYNVRRDAAKKLIRECKVEGSESHETAIMVFDFDNATSCN